MSWSDNKGTAIEAYESCGSCGADIGPSSTFPWHYAEEDCRAIREPAPNFVDRISEYTAPFCNRPATR